MAAGNVVVTVTGIAGAGQASVATVIRDVASVNFRFRDGVVEITQQGGPTASYEYSNMATVTISPSAKTVTLST